MHLQIGRIILSNWKEQLVGYNIFLDPLLKWIRSENDK